MKHLFTTIFIILLLVPVLAQGKSANGSAPKKERTTILWGHVRDSFTKVGIKGVKITLPTAPW